MEPLQRFRPFRDRDITFSPSEVFVKAAKNINKHRLQRRVLYTEKTEIKTKYLPCIFLGTEKITFI